MLYLSGVVRPGLPTMRTPDIGNKYNGMVWAADNGCYSNPKAYTDERYLAWLDRQPRADCLFASAPDVVGDAQATLKRAAPMLLRIKAIGFPVALVAQDGLTVEDVPWEGIDALFIGGSTEWKLGPEVPPLVDEAKRRGKWVHMGRVNSWRRLEYARAIGCDSVDGTILRFNPAVDVMAWMERAQREPHIWKVLDAQE